jgi:hypothetical protein
VKGLCEYGVALAFAAVLLCGLGGWGLMLWRHVFALETMRRQRYVEACQRVACPEPMRPRIVAVYTGKTCMCALEDPP